VRVLDGALRVTYIALCFFRVFTAHFVFSFGFEYLHTHIEMYTPRGYTHASLRNVEPSFFVLSTKKEGHRISACANCKKTKKKGKKNTWST